MKAQEGWEPWRGKVRPPALVAGELPHPLLACPPRLSWGLCLSYDVAGDGTPHPTHLPMQVLLRHGHSPGALLGLTVTFLPELPARPSLLRWRYLRTLPALSALLPTRVLSRHKDQRSDGFSLSLLLWGRGGKVPSSAIPPQQPPSFTLDTAPPHHQASLPLLSLPRGSCSRGGSWFIPAPPPWPCELLLGCSPPAAASGEKQPPFSPLLPPSLPRPCLCQVPPLSQASERPGDRRAMLKAFSQF